MRDEATVLECNASLSGGGVFVDGGLLVLYNNGVVRSCVASSGGGLCVHENPLVRPAYQQHPLACALHLPALSTYPGTQQAHRPCSS